MSVIKVQNISKHYVRNDFRPSLRHEAGQILRRLIGKQTRATWESEPFWAVKDVSFSIERGERIAIIGRNGAGKTTLLRLLCGITDPTHGSIEIEGRFVGLLGLGAGFDHERSGRENVYLNAAIYGVDPADVPFEDIVNFSELSEFIDRPVKSYSSGMVARLGFSVAIHIAPDVLFLDEILSVGDAAFQRKCLDRIHELARADCTLVFVSHVHGTMEELCERAIWLHRGQLILDGPMKEVNAAYDQFLMDGILPTTLPSLEETEKVLVED